METSQRNRRLIQSTKHYLWGLRGQLYFGASSLDWRAFHHYRHHCYLEDDRRKDYIIREGLEQE
jgi:hypothetical protein